MTYPQQQGPYGQQHGGYHHQGPYGGHGGPPPKKSNAPVAAVVVVLVALLAGLGITGFVAPGFFLGDDEKSAGSGSGDGDRGIDAGGGGGDGGSGIDQFASTLVNAANEQDTSALKGLKCADATDTVDEAVSAIGQTDGAELSDTTKVSDDEYIVVIGITYQGNSAPFAATVVMAENDWCWQDFAPGRGSTGGGDNSGTDSGPGSGPAPPSTRESSGSGGSGSADGKAFVQEFLDAINAKDASTAENMYCSDTPGNKLVDFVIGKNPQLEIAELDRPGASLESYTLGGTMDGKPLNTGRVSVRVSGSESPCIYTFIAG